MGDKKCSHTFIATAEKGRWTVKALSTNNRGEPENEEVQTTIFRCRDCGANTEYPDEWEQNFVAPPDAGRVWNNGKKRERRKEPVTKKRGTA